MNFRYIITVVLTLLCLTQSYAEGLPAALSSKLDSMIQAGLKNKAFPGASMVVGDKNGIIYKKNYGFHDYTSGLKVADDDLYDIASCTKVLSTTFVIMNLYDDGKIKLDQQIGDLVPKVKNTCLSSITVQELLTHTSGIPSQVFYPAILKDPLLVSNYQCGDYCQISDNLFVNPAVDTLIINRMCKGYNPANRGKYKYNDTNFWLLKLAAENITGKTLDVMTAGLYAELQCNNTGYHPLEWKSPEKIAPTENDIYLRKCIVWGYAHDELAAVMGGVGGNAGLFSCASDMANFCEMVLNDGNFRGKQIISKETVRKFTSSPLRSKGVYRGLGFDKRSGPVSELGGDETFGHTGFTGTIFWIDRSKGFYMIFLSNSVHPTRTNNQLVKSQLRLKLWAALSDNMNTGSLLVHGN